LGDDTTGERHTPVKVCHEDWIPFVKTGTLTAGTSLFKYTGNDSRMIAAAGYYDLELLPSVDSKAFTLGAGTITCNDLTIGNGTNTGTVNATTNDTVIDAAGSVVIAANGTLEASDSAVFTVGGSWSNAGAFTHNDGTVTFDGTVAQTITGATTWNNLTIDNDHGTPNDTNDVDPSAVQTVAGTLTITDGQWTPYTGDDYAIVNIGTNGIVKPDSSASVTVSSSWTNSGTFTSNSDTVVFDGTC